MRVAVHVNNTEVRLVALDRGQVVKWGTARLEPGLVKDGHILQPETVATTIESLFRSQKVPASSVCATISGLSFTYRQVRLPRIKTVQMEEAVQRAARKEIPLPLEEIYLSWQAIDTAGEDVDVFMLGVPRTFIDDLARTMKLAGVKLDGIDLKSLALARAAGKANALLIDSEPDCFDIMIIVDGMPTILHTVNPRAEGATIEDSVRHLVDELTRTVDFYNITHADKPIKTNMLVLLSGTLGTDEATRRLIQKNIEYPIEPLAPQVRFAIDFPVSRYASCVGLALKPPPQAIVPRTDAGRFYDINLNLLAQKRRLEVTKVPLSNRLLPVALVLAVILLISLLLMRSRSHAETVRLTEQVDRINRELRLTRLRIDEATKTEATIKKLLDEVKAIKVERQNIAGKGVSTSLGLQTLMDTLQGKWSLSSIQADAEAITVTGRANNKTDIIALAYALEKLGIFDEVRISRIDNAAANGGGTTAGVEFSIVLKR